MVAPFVSKKKFLQIDPIKAYIHSISSCQAFFKRKNAAF